MAVNGDGVNCGLITLYGFRAGERVKNMGLNPKNTFLNCNPPCNFTEFVQLTRPNIEDSTHISREDAML